MLVSLASLITAGALVASQQTGNHPEWDRWCGKVYQAGFPSFDPGGQTVQPSPAPGGPLLYVQFKPRYSLYVDSEKQGEFVVNAALSPYFGLPLPDMTESGSKLDFTITLGSTGATLVKDSVDLNSTGSVFKFDLSLLKPALEACNVTLSGTVKGGKTKYSATSEVLFLPDKKSGSVTKLDNLHGGMLFKNTASNGKFEPLLGYGFYASYDGFLGKNNTSVIQRYADWGLNAMTPLTQYPQSADAFAYMDKINLKYQYDLREGYMNLTWVEQNVRATRDNEGIFSYWSADEPDGHQDPFNATVLAYDLIRRLDPYHPVAVVLNCQNFYFKEYTAAADIIMEDVYPIGINSSFSKWNTTCNTTLGDCGCDNCQGGAHAVQDVRDRLEDLARYEKWLGLWPKMKIHNPQSFHGEGYWARDPTPAEEFAMNLLAINHGAQSIISWVYPPEDVLSAAHGSLAKVVTKTPIIEFLVGNDRPHRVVAAASPDIDVAYWVKGKELLAIVVNSGYADVTKEVAIELPGVAAVEGTPWGNLTWTLSGSKLSTPSLPALGTSIVLLKLS